MYNILEFSENFSVKIYVQEPIRPCASRFCSAQKLNAPLIIQRCAQTDRQKRETDIQRERDREREREIEREKERER